MWARLDDELIDHQKVFIAGEIIGKNGPVIAIGFFALGLMWSNKHLTDGFLPDAVVKGFRHVEHPRTVADALARAELFDKVEGGYQIHDYKEYNPSATDIKAKRKHDRIRKAEERARANGR